MNVLPLYVSNPEEMLNASYLGAGALGRVESSATQVGGYAELGTFALVAGTYYYPYYHSAGTPGLWYQVRYSAAGGGSLTGYDTAFQGGRVTLSRLERIRRLVNPDAVPGSAADMANDGLLIGYMVQVTDLIHTMVEPYFLQDPIGSGTSTLTFDGQYGNEHSYGGAYGGQSYANRFSRLYVSRGIRSVSTLKLRYGGTGSAQITVPSTAYVLRPTAQERDPGQPAKWLELVYPPSYTFALPGSDIIEIVGTFGYDSVPPLIEGISDRTVLRAWRARGAGLGESLGGEAGGSYMRWAMSKDDEDILQSHFSEWPLVR
jgi:hypothetical protein